MKNKDFDFEGKFNEEFENLRKNIKKPNILVCGGTGVGKSTLVQQTISDSRLRSQIKVGAGKPITQSIECYEGDLIRIYDSPGYEAGDESQAHYQKLVLGKIFESMETAESRIHMVWYCISQGNHRVFDIDISTINKIRKEKIPVAVILTQADKASEEDAEKMKEVIHQACAGVPIFETSTDTETALSVAPLLEWTADNVADGLRTAFISGTKVSIDKKAEEGRRIVLHHIMLATGIAATPIPLSDAPLLLANQATLVARLGSLWDLPTLSVLTKGVLTSTAVSTAGKTLAGSLLKFTGVGVVIGGAINATIAASITAGIGYGVNEMLAMMARDELAGKKTDIGDYISRLPDLITLFKSKKADPSEVIA